MVLRYVFLAFMSFMFLANPTSACHLSDLTINQIDDLGNGQYRFHLTFCTGAGLSATHRGADQNTHNFAFVVHGGATITNHPNLLTSPATQIDFFAFRMMNDTYLYFEDNEDGTAGDGYASANWACIDGGCGPVRAVCQDIIFETQGMPSSIELLGMEAGGNPAVGCPLSVNPACFNSNFAALAPVVPTVYAGYSPTECTDISVSLVNGSGNYAYEWSTGAQTANINVCPTQTSTYSVEVTDTQTGCVATADVEVPVENVACGSKVRLCYRGAERCIRESRVQRLLNKGATLGYCQNALLEFGSPIVEEAAEDLFIELRENQIEVSLISNSQDWVEAKLIGLDGRLVAPLARKQLSPSTDNEIIFPTQALSKGMYILTVTKNNELLGVKKIMITQ